MFKELAQYVAAKHKATEVTGEEGDPVKTEMTVRERLHSINGKSLGPLGLRPDYNKSVRKYEELKQR